MNVDDIRSFLIRANKFGYGNEEAVKPVAEKDGSHTIVYEEGDWKFHDNYFGGEPYGGREVIFYQNQPVWMMVYYGAIINPALDVNLVYKFLRQALMKYPKDLPMRGPSELEEGDWRYVNKTNGVFEDFFITEFIYYKKRISYTAQFKGGFVDVK